MDGEGVEEKKEEAKENQKEQEDNNKILLKEIRTKKINNITRS